MPERPGRSMESDVTSTLRMIEAEVTRILKSAGITYYGKGGSDSGAGAGGANAQSGDGSSGSDAPLTEPTYMVEVPNNGTATVTIGLAEDIGGADIFFDYYRDTRQGSGHFRFLQVANTVVGLTLINVTPFAGTDLPGLDAAALVGWPQGIKAEVTGGNVVLTFAANNDGDDLTILLKKVIRAPLP